MTIDLPSALQALIAGFKPIADVGSEIDEAQDILEDDEWGYAWSRGVMPISMIVSRHPFEPGVALAGETPEEGAERLQRVRDWMASRGGAGSALLECPVLLLADSEGVLLLDGWHRIVVAIEQGLAAVPAAVGISTSPVCAARFAFGLDSSPAPAPCR